jgi:hypothetical protein
MKYHIPDCASTMSTIDSDCAVMTTPTIARPCDTS